MAQQTSPDTLTVPEVDNSHCQNPWLNEDLVKTLRENLLKYEKSRTSRKSSSASPRLSPVISPRNSPRLLRRMLLNSNIPKQRRFTVAHTWKGKSRAHTGACEGPAFHRPLVSGSWMRRGRSSSEPLRRMGPLAGLVVAALRGSAADPLPGGVPAAVSGRPAHVLLVVVVRSHRVQDAVDGLPAEWARGAGGSPPPDAAEAEGVEAGASSTAGVSRWYLKEEVQERRGAVWALSMVPRTLAPSLCPQLRDRCCGDLQYPTTRECTKAQLRIARDAPGACTPRV
ncbi:hypothetical protein Anapl_18108 [Anas platyrhynchos]|uniref:Uncharacterized protein n=4 Tax=Anatidae TaxID=8830 RepID=R0JST1_ANAPL|nr:hypothetical protein Anapl_18108 [Anas platyrhynchos]